jgi:hypothetical protein
MPCTPCLAHHTVNPPSEAETYEAMAAVRVRTPQELPLLTRTGALAAVSPLVVRLQGLAVRLTGARTSCVRHSY